MAKMISKREKHPGKERAGEAAHLLFALSRVSLPDVRGNRFWPEVTRELRLRSGMDIPAANVPDLYRRWLRKAYLDRIDLDTHHKYVALVFDQAGIGSDRNKIIGLFLQALVTKLAQAAGEPLEKQLVRNAFASFEAAAKVNNPELASDIGHLRLVLVRAGSAVVEFAAFIQQYPEKWVLASWPWERIKQVWKDASGLDPESLTPSAQDVLAGIVAQLSSTMTRDDAFRGILERSLRIQLPGDRAADHSAHAFDLPIGPAQIEGAFGKLDVLLVDHPALTPSVLAEKEKEEWHSLDNLHYRVSRERFAAPSPTGRDVPAVPHFVGARPRDAQQVGYYWGMQFPAGERPRRERPHAGGREGAQGDAKRLYLDWTFLLQNGGLKLRIRGLRAPSLPDSETGRLVVGGMPVWEGALDSGVPQAWSGCTVTIEEGNLDGKHVVVALEAGEGDRFELRLSVAVLWQPAIVSFRSRVVREYTTFAIEDSGRGDLALYVEPGVVPDATDALIAPSGESVFAGRAFKRYSVQPFAAGSASSVIRVRAREWNFVRFAPFQVQIDLPLQLNVGAISVSTTGSLRVVQEAQGFDAVLVPAQEWQGAPDHLRLHIQGASGLRLPIERGEFLSVDGAWRLPLSDILDKHGFASGDEVTFGIGAWDRPPEELFTVLRVRPPEVIPCRLGAPSSIGLPSAGAAMDVVTSREPVTVEALKEKKLAVGRRSLGAGDVWFSWKPVAEDIVVAGKIGGTCNYEATSIDALPTPLTAVAFGSPGDVWTLNLGTSSVSLAPGESADLEKLLLSWREANPESVASGAELKGNNGRIKIAWRIWDRLVVEGLDVCWADGANGFRSVRVSASIRAMFPETLTLRVLNAGRSLSEQQERLPEPKGTGERKLTWNLAVPPVFRTGGRGESIAVEVEYRGVVVASSALGIPEEAPEDDAPGALEREIQVALSQYRRGGNELFAEHALVLVAKYTALYGRLPFTEERLLAPVLSANVQSGARSRKLMLDSIRLLGGLGRKEAAIVPDYGGKECPLLRTMAATLVVFQQVGFAQSGIMVPEILRAACSELDNLETGGLPPWRNWCRAVRLFGGKSLSRHSVEPSTEGTVENAASLEALDGLQRTLTALCPPFKEWAQKLP